jgi:hypothetical protein
MEQSATVSLYTWIYQHNCWILSHTFMLLDMDLLTHLNTMALMQPPWRLVAPPPVLISKRNWALSRQLPLKTFQHPTIYPLIQHGPSGQPSVETSHMTHSYKTSLTLYHSCQFFAKRYHVGTLAFSHFPVKSRTVEAALSSVGQRIASLGYRDPWLQPKGKLGICLHCQLQAYTEQDHPPTCVKLSPFQTIQHMVLHFYPVPNPRSHDYPLPLQPRKYGHTNNPSAAPFQLCDIHLLCQNVHLDALHCPEADLDSATHVALENQWWKSVTAMDLLQQFCFAATTLGP